MTITRTQIEHMRRHGRLRIDTELEAMILATYGVEPEPYTYTEQDLYEQIRKLINEHNQAHPDPRLNSLTPWERARPTPKKPTEAKGANKSN